MAQEPKLIAVVPRSATEQMQISINKYKEVVLKPDTCHKSQHRRDR